FLSARSATAGQRELQLGELPALAADDVLGDGSGAAAVPAAARARPGAQLPADLLLSASANRHPDTVSGRRGAVHERAGGAFSRFCSPDRHPAPVLVLLDAGGLLARCPAHHNRRGGAGTGGALAEPNGISDRVLSRNPVWQHCPG